VFNFVKKTSYFAEFKHVLNIPSSDFFGNVNNFGDF